MKYFKIYILLLLCALLAGCASKDGYVYYPPSYMEEKMEENRETYTGKTVTLLLSTPYEYTLTNEEGQSLIKDEKGIRGDLLLLGMRTYIEMLPDYFIPYSNSFVLTTPKGREKEKDRISITYEENFCSVSAFGTTRISIANCCHRLKLEGSGQIDANLRAFPLNSHNALRFEGCGSECITVEFTETGAIANGFNGICKISYDDNATTYTCDGKAFEVDVVSQPGEILVTPIEG